VCKERNYFLFLATFLAAFFFTTFLAFFLAAIESLKLKLMFAYHGRLEVFLQNESKIL
jgi:hypothetical protein